MNEELKKELTELEKRISEFNESKKKLCESIRELEGKGMSVLSKKEVAKLSSLKNELSKLETSENNVINPKCSLLSNYINAEEYISKLYDAGITNSEKIKAVNELSEMLIKIKKEDPEVLFTEDDARKLQIEINNPEAFNDILSSIATEIDNIITLLIADINKELDNLEKNDGKLDKKTKEKIKKIGITVGLLAAMIGIIASCSKSNNKNKVEKPSDSKDDLFGIEDTISTKELTKTNTSYLDDEINGLDETISENTEPTPTVAFDPTTDKETDMNNRANLIAQTGFFEDLYNSEIVTVLDAVDSKTLLNDENVGLANLFRNKFNKIYEHYLFNNITEDDIKSVDALKHLAKDNSDLDRFLETFSELLKDILRNPESQEAKDKMTAFIQIYAEYLNGFNNPYAEQNYLTDDQEFNEHAMVDDFENWWMVHDLIIGPTYYMFMPKELESYDTYAIDIIYETKIFNELNSTNISVAEYIDSLDTDSAYKGYLKETTELLLTQYPDAVSKALRLTELNYTMYSALVNSPKFCEVTSINDMPKLTLGGEE